MLVVDYSAATLVCVLEFLRFDHSVFRLVVNRYSTEVMEEITSSFFNKKVSQLE